MTEHYQKKIKLGKKGRQTKWAPFWIILKKYGLGKKVHPSQATKRRRNWRQTKLKIKSRRVHKRQIG
jgi:ribosomal protein L39E